MGRRFCESDSAEARAWTATRPDRTIAAIRSCEVEQYLMTPERRTYARRKRRSFQHIMEEESGQILRVSLPKEWVIHEYSPDYGIDGTVEMFAYVDDS